MVSQSVRHTSSADVLLCAGHFLLRLHLLTRSDALTWAGTSQRPASPLQRSYAKVEDVQSSAGTVRVKFSRSTTRSRDRGLCVPLKRSAYSILPHNIQKEAIMLKNFRISRPNGSLDGHLPHGPSEGYMEKFPYNQ